MFAVGAGGSYEAIANPKDAAHQFVKFFREKLGKEVNLLVINTRGIGDSGGAPSLHGAALDYYTAWNFLESKGIDTVLPWGHSLGFRYIVQAASWKQEETLQKINIVSDRSFDDIGKEAGQLMGAGIKGKIVDGVMQYAGWGGSAQEYWNKLQGKKIILVCRDDTVVPYSASFYKRIQANSVAAKGNTTVIKLKAGEDDSHTRIYTHVEMKAIIELVGPILAKPSISDGSIRLAKPHHYKTEDESIQNKKKVAFILGVLLIGVIALKVYGKS